MFSRLLIKDLTPKAKRIINYLERNHEEVLKMNISEFSVKMGVYPSFVTKTLKKVGYNGWKDWVSFSIQKIIATNPKNNYVKYLDETLFRSIKKTIENIDMLKLNMLIKRVQNKNFNGLAFVGNGYSLYICRDQNRRYNRININSIYIDEKTGNINSIDENKIIFVISISGYTSLTNKQLKFIKEEKKATLILISGMPLQEINPAFDLVIVSSIIDRKKIIENQAPTNSRIILYSILDMIFFKIFNLNEEKNISYLEMLNEH